MFQNVFLVPGLWLQDFVAAKQQPDCSSTYCLPLLVTTTVTSRYTTRGHQPKDYWTLITFSSPWPILVLLEEEYVFNSLVTKQ